MARSSATSAEKIAIATRRMQVLELRKSGASLRQIADLVHVAPETVRKDIQAVFAVLHREQQATAEAHRDLELARLDDYLIRLDSQIKDGNAQAIDRALRISERRAKLLGLDAPVKQELSGDIGMKHYTTGSNPDVWDHDPAPTD